MLGVSPLHAPFVVVRMKLLRAGHDPLGTMPCESFIRGFPTICVCSQNLALMLWSFAKLGESPGAPLLAAAVERFAASLPAASPQNVSNLLWALATLTWSPPKGLLQVGQRVVLFRGPLGRSVLALSLSPLIVMVWGICQVCFEPLWSRH